MDKENYLNSEIQEILPSLSERESELISHPNILLSGEQIVKNILKSSSLNTWVNIIPGGEPTLTCHPTLVVTIGQNDDVEKCILQAVEHIAARCRGKTTNVIFWAVCWSSYKWPNHKSSFRNINVVLKPFFAHPTQLDT